jgi:FXSXX-COOH protein
MDVTGDQRTDGHESDLVDLSQVSLDDLRSRSDASLSRALRRILQEADRPQDAIAGFQSAI